MMVTKCSSDAPVRLPQRVDRLADLVGDLHLHREPDERRQQREPEHPLVREDDRQHAPDPRGALPATFLADRSPSAWAMCARGGGYSGVTPTGTNGDVTSAPNAPISIVTCRCSRRASRLRSSARFQPSRPVGASSKKPAISSRRASAAASAAARSLAPSRVRRSVSRRRSSGSAWRSTRPRPTRPSTTAVTDGRAHRQPAGEHRRRGGTLTEQREHPVLRQRQVERGQRHLDLLGEAGHRSRRAGDRPRPAHRSPPHRSMPTWLGYRRTAPSPRMVRWRGDRRGHARDGAPDRCARV